MTFLVKDNRGVMRTAEQGKPPDIDAWGTELVAQVVARLEQRIRDFESCPVPGVSAPSIDQQERKFCFLKELIAAHNGYKQDSSHRHRYSELHRIIKGFIVEFITQSERDIQPVNIGHGRNPEAKRYWDEQGPDALSRAKLPGMLHAAVSYNYLRENLELKKARPAAKFHAVGEIVRACIDVFREKYPSLALKHQTRASIYNDHGAVLDLAFSYRALFGPE